jgi:hypothetical protein
METLAKAVWFVVSTILWILFAFAVIRVAEWIWEKMTNFYIKHRWNKKIVFKVVSQERA